MAENKKKEELIPSFQVDHNRIVPGIYESRLDTLGNEIVTTFDIRMKYPNAEPSIHPNAMHTIEHVIATYLRNDDEWKDHIIYWGPMGCLTGCYLIVKGHPTPQEIYPLMLRAFEHLSVYDDVVPGATAENCGNYILHDLNMAKYEASQYVQRLKEHPSFEYPTMERILTEKGMTFFDS